MPGGLAMLFMMPVVGAVAGYVSPKYLISFGMAAVAVAMWHLTSLSGDADFSFFAWGRVYQTLGLPFLFIPITSASYAGLPPDKSAEASSLINVARNLGGSIGISIAASMLARSAQVHQSYLVDHLVQSSPAYQQAVRAAGALAPGSAPADGQRHAFALIAQTPQQQGDAPALYRRLRRLCAGGGDPGADRVFPAAHAGGTPAH